MRFCQIYHIWYSSTKIDEVPNFDKKELKLGIEKKFGVIIENLSYFRCSVESETSFS